jgi:hypothetical protein
MHPARWCCSQAAGTDPSEEIKAQTGSLKIEEPCSSGPPAAGGSFVGVSPLHNSISCPQKQPILPLPVPPGCLYALGGSPHSQPPYPPAILAFSTLKAVLSNLKAVAFNNLIPNQSQSGNQT